jgi:SAM-dependent methyltransferase
MNSKAMEKVERQFMGWEPTCTCNADVVPATVLDPFAGSGTTLAVAQKFGRKSVGTDLSMEYLELAAKRISRIPFPLIG